MVRIPRPFARRYAVPVALAAAALLALQCSAGLGGDSELDRDDRVVAPEPAEPAPPPIVIQPDVPHDVPGGQRLPSSKESNEVLAAFAWQQFFAMSWQSDYNTTTHSRGNPDRDWDYRKSYTPGQPLVWETYAHRSELRPWNRSLAKRPFDSPPEYLYELNATKPIPAGPGNPRFDLFVNLDEDNEIGSCDVYLGPGDPSSQPLVVYQAKVNRAEYDYVRESFPDQFDPHGKLSAAAQANITFFQNLASTPTTSPPAPPLPADGISLPAGEEGGSEGAIEIKTAFLLVTDENREALSDFFQTQGIYYTAKVTGSTTKDGQKVATYGDYEYHNGTFALLGMHIIHKTKSYPDFIFTSFEHVRLQEMDFEYILLTPPPPSYPGSNFNPFNARPAPGAFQGSQFGDRHRIVRQTGSNPTSNGQLYPIPATLKEATTRAHDALRKLNPDSVWLNYQLIGVQANITERWAETPSPGFGPNHFMANHVIESDAFLGNFFGPGFGPNPIPRPAQKAPVNPKGYSGLDGSNLWYEGKAYSMGGCKGCHGVAQTAFGTDFSFLLDFGANKPVVEPDTMFYLPSSPG